MRCSLPFSKLHFMAFDLFFSWCSVLLWEIGIGIEAAAMNHGKGIFIHICVWLGVEEIEQLIWIHSYRKVNLIIVALGQVWRESHLTLMNNLKYKGLVIPAIPYREEKRLSWERAAEKLSHSDPKRQGKTGLVQVEVKRKLLYKWGFYELPHPRNRLHIEVKFNMQEWTMTSLQSSALSCTNTNTHTSPCDAAWNSNANLKATIFWFFFSMKGLGNTVVKLLTAGTLFWSQLAKPCRVKLISFE